MGSRHPAAEGGVVGLGGRLEQDARETLESFLGAEEESAVWRSVCERSGVPFESEARTLDELAAIAEELKNTHGPLSLVGHSLSIQVRTFQLLGRTRQLDQYLKEAQDS